MSRGALVARLKEAEAQMAALRRSEALARQRCEYLADGVRAGRSDKGAAARQAEAARKLAAQHEEERRLLQRRAENLSAFLRKEKEAKEAVERDLAAERQRAGGLAVQLAGAQQQLGHMKDLLDEARQQYRHFLDINKQAVERASRLQDRLRRSGAALASARHEAHTSRLAAQRAESTSACMRRLLEELYMSKASGQLGAALQEQLDTMLQQLHRQQQHQQQPQSSAAAAAADTAASADHDACCTSPSACSPVSPAPCSVASPHNAPHPCLKQQPAKDSAATQDKAVHAAVGHRAASRGRSTGMKGAAPSRRQPVPTAPTLAAVAAAAAAGGTQGDETPGAPLPPDGGAGPAGMAAAVAALLEAAATTTGARDGTCVGDGSRRCNGGGPKETLKQARGRARVTTGAEDTGPTDTDTPAMFQRLHRRLQAQAGLSGGSNDPRVAGAPDPHLARMLCASVSSTPCPSTGGVGRSDYGRAACANGQQPNRPAGTAGVGGTHGSSIHYSPSESGRSSHVGGPTATPTAAVGRCKLPSGTSRGHPTPGGRPKSSPCVS
ncbi:hypothetical protein Agub_g799, partial [Astrephomene gubernaculifera]